MASFRSTGHTGFREGDEAIPDIAAERRGKAPQHALRGGASNASRRSRRRLGIVGRVLLALSRRGHGPAGGGRYELYEVLAAGLRKEADRRGLAEREVLEEAVRLYLYGRRGVE